MGLTPDIGERQRGRSQGSLTIGREECIGQLDGQTLVAGLGLITPLDSAATTERGAGGEGDRARERAEERASERKRERAK